MFKNNFNFIEFFIFSFIFFNISQSYADPDVSIDKELTKIHIVQYCSIKTLKGKLIRNFPGSLCIFLDDGRFVSSTNSEISMYDKNQQKVWSLKGHYHHQMNLTNDKKYILALTSNFLNWNGEKIRDDIFVKISLEGKIVAKGSALEVHDFFKLKKLTRGFLWDPASSVKMKDYFEHTHVNSIYEIPSNKYSNTHVFMKSGNIIINDGFYGMYILDSDFKKKYKFFKKNHFLLSHDASIGRSGEITYFVNSKLDDADSESLMGKFSIIESLDPVEMKYSIVYKADPPQIFYSPYGGGFQLLLDKFYFISNMSSGFLVLDKLNNKLVYAGHEVAIPTIGSNLEMTQRYQALDLTMFLKHWN